MEARTKNSREWFAASSHLPEISDYFFHNFHEVVAEVDYFLIQDTGIAGNSRNPTNVPNMGQSESCTHGLIQYSEDRKRFFEHPAVNG